MSTRCYLTKKYFFDWCHLPEQNPSFFELDEITVRVKKESDLMKPNIIKLGTIAIDCTNKTFVKD